LIVLILSGVGRAGLREVCAIADAQSYLYKGVAIQSTAGSSEVTAAALRPVLFDDRDRALSEIDHLRGHRPEHEARDAALATVTHRDSSTAMLICEGHDRGGRLADRRVCPRLQPQTLHHCAGARERLVRAPALMFRNHRLGDKAAVPHRGLHVQHVHDLRC
jgi:hypothetical protein